MSSPYHVVNTWVFHKQPRSTSMFSTGGFYHADKTVPRQDVASPFPPCGATSPSKTFARFACLGPPPPPVRDLPWGPGHPASSEATKTSSCCVGSSVCFAYSLLDPRSTRHKRADCSGASGHPLHKPWWRK